MKVRVLRERVTAAMATGMLRSEPEVVALTADRTKAMAVALVGLDADAEVDIETLELSTTRTAAVLGFHPEHVRRLIRTGRLRARRIGGDYRIRVTDLWPLLEIRHREPGRRRLRRR